MPRDDSELVVRVRAGSEDAARELVQRFQRPVFSMLLRMVRDRGIAEDLSQEVFIKAFRAIGSFQPGRKFSSWLFKIAHNTAIDHLRRSTLPSVPLETPGEGPDPLTVLAAPDDDSPERELDRSDLRSSFEYCLGRLRPDYREIVVLRYQEGLTYDEISSICELPMGTVKTHLHRARKALAREMTALGWGPSGRRAKTPSGPRQRAKPGRGGSRRAP